MNQRIVTYELFRLKCAEMSMKTDYDICQQDRNYISLYDVKERRHLATISKEIHNCFEITEEFPQEFWDYEEANPRIALISDLAMTPIDLRGEW